MDIDIVILNYNGEKLLEECLPSIVEAASSSKHAARVVVLDNRSNDASVEFIKKNFKDVGIYIAKENRFLCSFNEYAMFSSSDIIMMLNNDISVDKGFVDPMVRVFEEHEDAFMVAPKCYDFTGEALEGGGSKGYIKYGWFGAMAKYPGWEKDIDSFCYTFQSGFGAVRRDRFIELKGYDDLYLPGRLEDSDLCFRAWKRGWECYYQPESVVYHIGGVSFKKEFGRKGISTIDARNSALFFWKNIDSPSYWCQHVIFLPLRMLYWLLRGDFAAIRGFCRAFKSLGSIISSRKKEKDCAYMLSDRTVFSLFK